jgi:hypothetical protein
VPGTGPGRGPERVILDRLHRVILGARAALRLWGNGGTLRTGPVPDRPAAPPGPAAWAGRRDLAGRDLSGRARRRWRWHRE